MNKKPWLKHYADLGIQTPEFEDRPLGSYLEQHAHERGDSPALQYFDRTISYSEYNRQTNRIANALTALGVGKGDVVGMHMPNIPQYLFAVAAVSKIGAIGTGVSPLLTSTELAYQVENAGVKVLVSLADLAPAVSGMQDRPDCLQTIVFTGSRDFLDAPEFAVEDIAGLNCKTWLQLTSEISDQFNQVETHWNDTFMLQYTGGTTGRPKGAELSIRTLMHNPIQVATGEQAIDVGHEVIATAFPLFHVAGLSIIMSGTTFGAHTFLLPDPRDTDNFITLMKKFPPTRMAAVPALYDMLLTNPDIRSVDFSHLISAKTGAAPMTSDTYDRLSAVIGENKVTDLFGMTETGPCYIFHPLPKYKRGSVGFAIPGAEIRIMDVETGTKEMPCGEPGEICSTGPQTMKGYLNLPEESAHALREMDGKTWMYSGDVGYMDEEGYIFLCDRAKDMLIVGGYKVFSVELEDKLKSLPQVAESAVIGMPDEKRPGNDVVNLYVQLAPEYLQADQQQVRQDILDYMRENMSAYKVPKFVHFIDEIPLTPVGKIDKKALRS